MLHTIKPEDLLNRMKTNDSLYILDVRNEEKFQEYHIEGKNIEMIHIPKLKILHVDDEGHEAISGLPKNKEIIVTCTTGNSASKCVSILSKNGYQVTLLEGGITAWKECIQST